MLKGQVIYHENIFSSIDIAQFVKKINDSMYGKKLHTHVIAIHDKIQQFCDSDSVATMLQNCGNSIATVCDIFQKLSDITAIGT